MSFLRAPAAVLGLLAVTLVPSAFAKPVEELRELHNATQLELRACASPCGYYGQICCSSGQQCITNSNGQAECAAGTSGWIYSTFVYTETDLATRTSIWSSFVGAAPTAQATGTCSDSQIACGSICCDGGYYCASAGKCSSIGGGSSPAVTGIVTPSAPLRPTSSTLIIVTATGSATATVPFSTPIPTGANGTLVESNQGGGGGLSGGAIAGIVIGVILGIILLLLICFYCCAKAAFDSILAIFGFGKRKRRTHEETTYIEEHHHSGSAAAGGRRWYGQGSSRPSRPPKKESGGMGLLGLGAGLAGLAAVLGLKRKHDRKHHDDKSTTVTDSSYYYSDYTSSSSASSDDRRTRHTRHSSSRR